MNEKALRNRLATQGLINLVPKKGLEPPHPCGYMDLNHARLPIPPLRRGAAAERRREGYTAIYFTDVNGCMQTRRQSMADGR